MSKAMSKYEQIKAKIVLDIKQGTYKPNDKIPSESEYCRAFNTSRITVRKALDELTAIGILYKMQGIGTFVKTVPVDPVEQPRKNIVFILPFYIELFDSQLLSDIISGVESVLKAEGFSMVMIQSMRADDGLEAFLTKLKELNPAGMIYPFHWGTDIQAELVPLNIPIVFVDSYPDNLLFDAVTGDDYNSAYKIGRLLLEKDCEKIGYYSPVNFNYTTVKARAEGLVDALKDEGKHVEERWIESKREGRFEALYDDFVKLDMISDMKSYLKRNPDLDAVVVFNDTVAMAFYVAAEELGIHIPQQLKIVSYGNYFVTNYFKGGITTFEQHFSKYGEEAARLIVQRLRGGIPPIQQIRKIPYELIRRATF
ncbi:GntR family transcriptional regulator [Paenibacillus sp. FA6]|uniref:GntR family transcriptional regulator n=1 Tax=Paenibacillus sp. FA6 TaxID=3413029 RepID=UPI003F65D6F7